MPIYQTTACNCCCWQTLKAYADNERTARALFNAYLASSNNQEHEEDLYKDGIAIELDRVRDERAEREHSAAFLASYDNQEREENLYKNAIEVELQCTRAEFTYHYSEVEECDEDEKWPTGTPMHCAYMADSGGNG